MPYPNTDIPDAPWIRDPERWADLAYGRPIYLIGDEDDYVDEDFDEDEEV